MDFFILDNINTSKLLKLNALDSYIIIKSVAILINEPECKDWSNIVSSLSLSAELKYVVYIDPEGRFVDERIKQFPIHLVSVSEQNQSLFNFNINQRIDNEALTLGMNPVKKFYTSLKLELMEVQKINIPYALQFTFEKYKME